MGQSQKHYDAKGIAAFFDEYGEREWERLVATPVDEVSLYVHSHYLMKYVPAGGRVLEIGAGAGRFTQVLAGLEARIVVADISPVQLEINRRHAGQHGFDSAVEEWRQADICAMDAFADESFECVVAYGGPLSYALDRRDEGIRECKRVLKPGGLLLCSVMSLWGTIHRHLVGVLETPPAANRAILDSGDISPATFPERQANFMHLFRAGELRRWLAAEFEIVAMSACGCLSTGRNEDLEAVRRDPERWGELLEMEVEASAERESINLGTHIICVARKQE